MWDREGKSGHDHAETGERYLRLTRTEDPRMCNSSGKNEAGVVET